MSKLVFVGLMLALPEIARGRLFGLFSQKAMSKSSAVLDRTGFLHEYYFETASPG